MKYHQSKQELPENEYLKKLKILEYDILYGKKEIYGGETPYEATDLKMGIDDIEITDVYNYNNTVFIEGSSFNDYSCVLINGKEYTTEKVSDRLLRVNGINVKKDDVVVVAQKGMEVCDHIRAIVKASIPVCAHLGLTPQSVNAFGGFKVQGKGEEAAQRLLDEARAVEEAGAFAVVLECVPQALAEKITKSIHIPTIGIGAGAGCDGQVLVYQDMLGMYSDMVPKFAKQYAQVGTQMKEAFAAYRKEVADGTFPAPEHTFKMDETILDKLY